MQVRNVGRVGLAEYSAYLADLHRNYPDYHVKPTQVGGAAAAGRKGEGEDAEACLEEQARDKPSLGLAWVELTRNMKGMLQHEEHAVIPAVGDHAGDLCIVPSSALPANRKPGAASPLQFGIVDNRSMFVSFEGQVSAKSPKFFVSPVACQHGSKRAQPSSVLCPAWSGHGWRKAQGVVW